MAVGVFHDLFRHLSAQNLTTTTTGATSTSSVAAQTRFVRLCPVLVSSVPPAGGVYYGISEPGATAIDSTTGTFLPAGCSNATVLTLNVTQETD